MFNPAKMPDPATMLDPATTPEPVTMSDYHYNDWSIPHVTLTDSYCTIHVKISPPCHSERSGTDIENQAIKLRNAAESNPEGAPAGGISALV